MKILVLISVRSGRTDTLLMECPSLVEATETIKKQLSDIHPLGLGEIRIFDYNNEYEVNIGKWYDEMDEAVKKEADLKEFYRIKDKYNL